MRPPRLGLRLTLLLAATTCTLTAQVTVQVLTSRPLHLQAQIAGGPLQTVIVPTGTDLTHSGSFQAQSMIAGGGGGTALAVTVNATPAHTTCELVAGASFYVVPAQVAFNSQESGEERVLFTSATTVGGVLMAEAQFTPSTGPAMGNGTMTADFGADGSIELVTAFGGVARYAQPRVLGPGQDLLVRVAHQGVLAGPQIGEYSSRITLRFVPHADGFDFYGPTTGCQPAGVMYSMAGTSLLVVGMTSTPVDFRVLAIGQNQLSVAMPFPSPCPSLTSADLLIVGPFTTNLMPLPFHAIPAGASVYMQFVGLRLATLTAEASRGIHGFGQ